MDIHFTEEQDIRDQRVKFIFFNSSDWKSYNQNYINLVNNSPILKKDKHYNIWKIKDKLSNTYRIARTSLLPITHNNPNIYIDENSKRVFYDSITKERFLMNNGYPGNTKISKDFITNVIQKLPLELETITKSVYYWNMPKTLYQHLFAFAIIDNVIVGKIVCEVLNDEEMISYFRDRETIFPEMKLYISSVDIHEDYQGKGLCTPLTSYMIKNLKRIGYDMLFIENASSTKKGVPACICYYKAGIKNNYNMRYRDDTLDSRPIKKMNLDDCLKPEDKMPTTYYYVSDKYAKSGLKKLKKAVSNIKSR